MTKTIFETILNSVKIAANAIGNVAILGKDPILPTSFLIGEANAAAIAAVGYVASELWYLKKHRRQNIEISVRDAAIAQRSWEYLKVLEGNKQNVWDPISGFYQTQDNRWIQYHCNFPHHRQGVIDLLQCEDNKEAVVAATKNWPAQMLEDKLAAKGMCAAMVRTQEEWAQHPQAESIKALPLLEIIKIGDSKAETLPLGNRPLSGIKVLDLTRVIAGPICGRTLAEHGAEVMLISSPYLPFILPLVMDTGFGKLSSYLDINNLKEKQKLLELVKSADIFVQSYHPAGLDKRGFSPEKLAELRPGIIYVSVSAYSHVGPWANRRGFDSLVQSATGIAAEQGSLTNPKHLPAQALDYITGYLAAFGAMEALRRRTLSGGC